MRKCKLFPVPETIEPVAPSVRPSMKPKDTVYEDFSKT